MSGRADNRIFYFYYLFYKGLMPITGVLLCCNDGRRRRQADADIEEYGKRQDPKDA